MKVYVQQSKNTKINLKKYDDILNIYKYQWKYYNLSQFIMIDIWK